MLHTLKWYTAAECTHVVQHAMILKYNCTLLVISSAMTKVHARTDSVADREK